MEDLRKHAGAIVNEVLTTEKQAVCVAGDRFKHVVSSPAGKIYPEGVSACRDVAHHNLEAHKKLSDSILSRVTTIAGVPCQARQVSDKVQKLSGELVDAQSDLVNGVCDVLLKLDPAKTMKSVVARTRSLEKGIRTSFKGKKPAAKKRTTTKRPSSKRKTQTKTKAPTQSAA